MVRFRPDLSDEPAVRLDGVSLTYERTGEVLSEIDLVLRQGSFTFLTGPSGAGKSSLLKLMYLAHGPTRGGIRLFGQQTYDLKRKQLAAMRRRIGVVFQEFRLLDHLTAFENVALPLRVLGQKPDSYQNEVIDLLRWVGLGERVDAPTPSLSGGEQQRVAIARALINKPDLLIADEPTGNVDPEMGRKILRLFAELNKRVGTTILIATHDLELIREFDAPVLRLSDDGSAERLAVPRDGAAYISAISPQVAGLRVFESSWIQGGVRYLFDPATGQFSDDGLTPKGKFDDMEGFVSREVMVTSHDGTQVPVSILHRADIELNGKNPTIVYGYGSYGITIPAGFRVTPLSLVDRGRAAELEAVVERDLDDLHFQQHLVLQPIDALDVPTLRASTPSNSCVPERSPLYPGVPRLAMFSMLLKSSVRTRDSH